MYLSVVCPSIYPPLAPYGGILGDLSIQFSISQNKSNIPSQIPYHRYSKGFDTYMYLHRALALILVLLDILITTHVATVVCNSFLPKIYRTFKCPTLGATYFINTLWFPMVWHRWGIVGHTILLTSVLCTYMPT